MKVTLAQNSFTTGEIAPRAYGRKDMERYLQGLKYARNGHPVIHGGFKRRAGTLYVADAISSSSNSSILVPFNEGQGKAWMLEFGNATVRIYDTDLTYTGIEIGSPYNVLQLDELDWAQSDSTLWLAHPDVAPQRLQRLADDVWVLGEAPFTTMPFDQIGRFPATTLTLSAATVGVGRTATAGASTFLESDVGRGIISVAGIAVITGYTSATVVTVEITRAFASVNIASGDWQLESSPQSYMYPGTAQPVGVVTDLYAATSRAATLTLSGVTGAITIDASAGVFVAGDTGKKLFAGAGMATVTYVSATQVTAVVVNTFDTQSYSEGQWGMPWVAWRTDDVGSMVRVNGGLVRVDSVTSSALARGTVLRELAGAVLAPPLSWQLESTVWNATFGYPRSVTIHQQRSIFGGSEKYPRTVWGSRTGEPLDFERWTDDSDSFAWTIDGDEATAIRYVTSNKQLAALTESAEYSLRSGVEKPLTPTNVRVVSESNHGCAQVRPAQINQEQLFVQAAGRKVRAFGYRYDLDEYRSPDVSALAEHITKSGITWLTYAQEKEQLLYATRADGKFLTCTIDRDQQPTVIGWAQHDTVGFVECVQSIPGPDRTQVWAIVRRTVDGLAERYIEVFDDAFEPLHPSVALPEGMEDRPVYGCTVDSGKVFDNAGGMTTVTVAHLVGNKVAVVADGSVIWDGYSADSPTVPAGGLVTLPRSAKRVLVGLPFKTRATLLTPEMQTALGSAQGKPARTGEMVLNFLETIGATVENNEGNNEIVPFRSFGVGVLDNMPVPFTGGKKVNMLGWERGESEITIWQQQPLPLHLLSVVRMHSVGGA
jgi:hypothetical protein